MDALTTKQRTREEAQPDNGRLTHSSLLRMELHSPPAEAVPFVTTFFTLSCDEKWIRDVQPSSIGIVAAMARGHGAIRFLDGREEPSHSVTLLTPSTAAATFEVAGPWRVFGAMLSPLGWYGLTGWSAAEHRNRLYDGAKVLPPAVAEATGRIAAEFARLPASEMVGLLAAAILGSLRPVPAAHVAFVEQVAAWIAGSLSPDVNALFESTSYGKRQVQRLAERYFGMPPQALARKYRALRAAVLLSRPSLTPDEQAAILDRFYDQPHMIREIRLFAGRTPARIADPDTPYLSSFLDLRDFDGGGSRLAPIPKDLRA